MTPAARQVLNALQAAGEDGRTGAELAFVGGRWWRERVAELCDLGHKVGEQHGLYFLVASTEPPASGDRPLARDVGLPRPEYQAGAGGSVDAAETLFELPVGSVYDLDAAA